MCTSKRPCCLTTKDVLRRKQQNKKHKTWDGDAYISHEGDKLTMISEDGKMWVRCLIKVLRPCLTYHSMGSTAWKGELLCAGYSAYISGKEFQLDCEISGSQLPDTKEISLPEESTSLVEDPLHLGSQWSTANPSVSHEFISPASFYASPKSKPKGPLSVISLLIPLPLTLFFLLGTTPMPLMPLL